MAAAADAPRHLGTSASPRRASFVGRTSPGKDAAKTQPRRTEEDTDQVRKCERCCPKVSAMGDVRGVCFSLVLGLMAVHSARGAGSKIEQSQFKINCTASLEMIITFTSQGALQRLWPDDTDYSASTGELLNNCSVTDFNTTDNQTQQMVVDLTLDGVNRTDDTCEPNNVVLEANGEKGKDVYYKTVFTSEGTSYVFVTGGGAATHDIGGLTRWEVRCEYKTFYNETLCPENNTDCNQSLPLGSVQISPDPTKDGGLGSFDPPEVTMKILPKADLDNSTGDAAGIATMMGTNTIQNAKLSDMLSLVVYVTDAKNYWEFLAVRDCWASNTPTFEDNINTPGGKDKIMLVKNKCPVTDIESESTSSAEGLNIFNGGEMDYLGVYSGNQPTNSTRYNTSSAFRLDFTAFRIQQVQTVWFKCYVEVCPKKHDDKCSIPESLVTNGTCSSPARRKRAALDDMLSALGDEKQLVTLRAQMDVTDQVPPAPLELQQTSSDSKGVAGLSQPVFLAAVAAMAVFAAVGVAALGMALRTRRRGPAGRGANLGLSREHLAPAMLEGSKGLALP